MHSEYQESPWRAATNLLSVFHLVQTQPSFRCRPRPGKGGEAHSSFGSDLHDSASLPHGSPDDHARCRREPWISPRKSARASLIKYSQGTQESLYDRALGAAGLDHGLRIDLDLTAVPELMDLPWEFLNDGTDYIALRAAIVRQARSAEAGSPI